MVRGAEQHYSQAVHPALGLLGNIDRLLGIHHDLDRRGKGLRRVVGHAAVVRNFRVSKGRFPH